VTVTAGQEHLRADKTASSAETTSTGDTSIKAHVAKAMNTDTETASTVDGDLVTITGEASPTISIDNDDLVTVTGEAGATINTVDDEVVTITGEAAPTETSGSATYITRAFNVWAAVALTAFVALF
jgi:hypothetical protein